MIVTIAHAVENGRSGAWWAAKESLVAETFNKDRRSEFPNSEGSGRSDAS